MSDLQTMLREQLSTTINTQLASAVQAGDIAAAKKAADDLAKLNSAPAAAAGPAAKFTAADIRKELEAKAPWFGIDPRRNAKALEFGKLMDSNRFDSAAKFAEALIAAVDDEFKPAGQRTDENDENDGGEGTGEGDGGEAEAKPARKRTDNPNDSAPPAAARRSSNAPWTKLADAPADVQKQITKSADKYCSNASKEQREKFISTALSTHYKAHQARKGK